MGELEKACFEIISSAGAARSNFIEALELAKKNCFDEANQLIVEGEQFYKEAHQVHTRLIQQSMSEDKEVNIKLLLVHAEDILMSAEVIKIIILEIIPLYQS